MALPCDRIWFVPDVPGNRKSGCKLNELNAWRKMRTGHDWTMNPAPWRHVFGVAPWHCQERAKRKEDVQNSPLASKRLVWSTSEISKFTFEQARFYMWYRLPLISTAFFVSFFHCHHWLDQWCSSGSETQARRTADHWGGETLHGVFPSQWMVCFRENPHL